MYNSDGPLAEKLKKGYIMRKYVGKFLVGILALVMAFSLVACSSKYKTMEDYVQSSEVQEQIASVKEQVESAGMQIELKGEGDKLIYVYTIDSAYVTDTTADQLESGIQAQASTFEELAAALKKEVKVDNPIVVVQYIDSDGNEIFSQEFTAK